MGGSRIAGSRIGGFRLAGSRIGGSRVTGSRIGGSRMAGHGLIENITSMATSSNGFLKRLFQNWFLTYK